jgi:two-component system phosphate regulon response regulator OmpR
MELGKKHILIVDDDTRICDLLEKFLSKNGYLVSAVNSAEQARQILAGLEFDLIILDVMMPRESGIELTSHLREKNKTPIILLTAKGDSEDRILGLEAGADDYLPKPFEPMELLLRIKAVLRRTGENLIYRDNISQILSFGEVSFDTERNELWDHQNLIYLTSSESKIMQIFSKSLGIPITRFDLIKALRTDGKPMNDRAIDVQITRLRRKIETNPKEPRYLKTLRGIGYMLTAD